MIVGRTRNAEPTSPRERLQSSRNVHPISKQITGADHHITDMDPDAEVDLTVLREGRVGVGQGILSFHGTPDRINRTTKLGQHTVACGVDYAASVRSNQAVQDFPACRESFEGSDLIGTHEATIALYVSRKDSGQPALHLNWVCQR